MVVSAMDMRKDFVTEVIATYALCGFSNFGSMGILLGSMTAMAPERKHDMASIILRAMIAGNIACFFTACVAVCGVCVWRKTHKTASMQETSTADINDT